ncbi:efflux transporter periplasmic adaptor subunit, partial [Mesorhizobium sp. M1A.F.Ca.IN.020.32.1.1]
AIAADQNERVVYEVGQDGSVMTKPVRLGPRLHGYRVIRSGMTGEETIIVNGLMRVRPGVKVKPELVVLPQEAAQSAESAQ